MVIFFAKHQNGAITSANYPIKETGAESYSFEVTEQDVKDVHDGIKDWKIEGGKLSVVHSTRKADREAAILAAEQAREAAKEAKQARKLELISKVTGGNATKEEREEFANLI